MLRKRTMPPRMVSNEQDPLLPGDRQPSRSDAVGTDVDSPSRVGDIMNTIRRQPQWIILAAASGACAAFNGVFAKLTTTRLTSSWSHFICRNLGLAPHNKIIEFLIRASFFGLNLVFNICMWTLFTAALTRASSTTRVSIINVSANFLITALLGLAIFGEKLPAMWWLGAAFLAAGNVVIGRREEGEKPGGSIGLERDEEESRGETETLLGEEIAMNGEVVDELGGNKEGSDVDDPIK